MAARDRDETRRGRRIMRGWLGVMLLGLATGCGGRGDAGRVVVYTALDREFSEPVLKAFETREGVRVDAKYDVESTKTVGLVQSILAEAAGGRTRCDVFWNNEIINTLRLQRRGLLAPIAPPNARAFPAEFRAKDGAWFGFAARARILLVNTKLVAEADRPKRLEDLADPKWKGRVGLAKPLFGTTATHAVCLFAAWGDDRAKAFYRALKANDAQVLSGNKQVTQAVGSGAIAVGMTDTDDAVGELDAGSPVAIVYPDRGPDELGTLFIPNTVAVLKDAPHPAAAVRLVDALLAPAVEAGLARGPSAQIPLNPAVAEPARVETPKTVHAMPVDWDAAVGLWDRVMEFLLAEFGG